MKAWLRWAPVTAAMALAFLAGCASPGTSDEALIRNFKAHRAELTRLVEMLREDQGVRHLWLHSVTPKDAVTPARLAEYRRLMRAAKVGYLHAYWGRHSSVMLSAEGFRTDFDKGYSYAIGIELPLSTSLDLKKGDLPPYQIRYRELGEDNWYLYYASTST